MPDFSWAAFLYTAFKDAEQLGVWERVHLAFKKKQRILVLGSTGVGKSNFIQSLKESMPEAIEFVKSHAIRVPDRAGSRKGALHLRRYPGAERTPLPPPAGNPGGDEPRC